MTLFLVPPFLWDTCPSLDDRLTISLHAVQAPRAQRFPRRASPGSSRPPGARSRRPPRLSFSVGGALYSTAGGQGAQGCGPGRFRLRVPCGTSSRPGLGTCPPLWKGVCALSPEADILLAVRTCKDCVPSRLTRGPAARGDQGSRHSHLPGAGHPSVGRGQGSVGWAYGGLSANESAAGVAAGGDSSLPPTRGSLPTEGLKGLSSTIHLVRVSCSALPVTRCAICLPGALPVYRVC